MEVTVPQGPTVTEQLRQRPHHTSITAPARQDGKPPWEGAGIWCTRTVADPLDTAACADRRLGGRPQGFPMAIIKRLDRRHASSYSSCAVTPTVTASFQRAKSRRGAARYQSHGAAQPNQPGLPRSRESPPRHCGQDELRGAQPGAIRFRWAPIQRPTDDGPSFNQGVQPRFRLAVSRLTDARAYESAFRPGPTRSGSSRPVRCLPPRRSP